MRTPRPDAKIRKARTKLTNLNTQIKKVMKRMNDPKESATTKQKLVAEYRSLEADVDELLDKYPALNDEGIRL